MRFFLAFALVGCASSGEPTDGAAPGFTTQVKLFNGSPAFDPLSVTTSGGETLADALALGAATSAVDMPVRDGLRLQSGDAVQQLDEHDVRGDQDYSWFALGDSDPIRAEFVRDVQPAPIPGIGHVRMVVAHTSLPGPADVYVSGSVLAGGLSVDATFASDWQPVAEGQGIPLRLEVPGHPDRTTDLPDLSVEGGGVYTVMLVGDGAAVTAVVNPH